MKRKLSVFAGLLLICLTSFGQSQLNLVIFSEDGDQFFAYVNGIKQNDTPESNVKVTNLTSSNLSLRIEFSDKALPQLKQNMALEMGFEHTAKIKRDMKKQVKLRYFGKTPIDQATNTGVATVAYHTADNSSAADNSQPTNNNTITETTTSTQTNNNGNGAVNINVGSAGISMNVSGMDPNGATMNSTTSTTVTNANSSSSNYQSSNTDNGGNTGNVSVGIVKPACSVAMTGPNFAKMKQSVESKPFSDAKMSTAKVATKNACLSVEQVKEICKLFNMDDEKLTYAKYAYDFCVDKANFYQVSDVFSFSTSTEDLNQFLQNK